MRILHTSDWHIGHHLHDHTRHDEHQLFLEWLLNTIEQQRVDMLIVAGDIFDNANPSHRALGQYYDFLRQLIQTTCQHIIIIGGNHDSYGTLNAPRELLKYFNIHVVGKAHENLSDEIIVVNDKSGVPQMVVCAVPFLRDRDIRHAIAGESYADIEQRIKEGIIRRYQSLATCVQTYKQASVPVIATGHLFAAGGTVAEATERSEKDIHVGTLGNVGADDFPSIFDYIALGHLHRPQVVNQRAHIRYAGSPLPLSFSEFADKKLVLLLEFEKNRLVRTEPIPVPSWRKLVRLRGNLNQIADHLQAINDEAARMKIWAEVKVELDHFEPHVTQKVHELAKHRNIAVLKTQAIYTYQHQSLAEQLGGAVALQELTPEDVFRKKCESDKFDIDGHPDVFSAFKELLSEMEENQE